MEFRDLNKKIVADYHINLCVQDLEAAKLFVQFGKYLISYFLVFNSYLNIVSALSLFKVFFKENSDNKEMNIRDIEEFLETKQKETNHKYSSFLLKADESDFQEFFKDNLYIDIWNINENNYKSDDSNFLNSYNLN